MYQNQPFSADSGVWARSAGDYFPFIIYGQQKDADSPILYGVMGNGIQERLVGSYAGALSLAKQFKCWSQFKSLDWGKIANEVSGMDLRGIPLIDLMEWRDDARDIIDPEAFAVYDVACKVKVGPSVEEAVARAQREAARIPVGQPA